MNKYIREFKRKQFNSWFFCALFFVTLTGFSIERWHLARSIRDGYKFLVIGPNCHYLPRSLEFREARELHDDQAQLACETLLSRGPANIEHPERLKRLFHPTAHKKALELIRSETTEFEEKSMYQKVNIEETKLLKVMEQSVLFVVRGQLIRPGLFSEKSFVEVLNFELRGHLALNRNMAENGRYPTILTDFKLTTHPVSIH